MEPKYTQGEIIIAPFPYTDQANQKVRPVLIVSSHRHNTTSPDILVCAISTSVRQWNGIIIKNKESGLSRTSVVLPARIASVSKQIKTYRIGFLDKETFNEVLSDIYHCFS